MKRHKLQNSLKARVSWKDPLHSLDLDFARGIHPTLIQVQITTAKGQLTL